MKFLYRSVTFARRVVRRQECPVDIQLNIQGALAETVGRQHGVDLDTLCALAAQRGETLRSQIKREAEAGLARYLHLPDLANQTEQAKAVADEWRGRFDALVLLGTGGSSLGLQAIDGALRDPSGSTPQLRVIDNTDPATTQRALAGLKPDRTLCLVISKSGGTVDTLAPMVHVVHWYKRAGCDFSRHALAISEKRTGHLWAFADVHKIPVVPMPERVGGRFSVLSVVGLVPAALLGYDIDALLEGARTYRDTCFHVSTKDDPALQHALVAVNLDDHWSKRNSVLFAYDSRLWHFCEWYAQLWSESLGKLDARGTSRGQNVILAIGARAQHSMLQLFLDGPNDRLITLLAVREHEEDYEFHDADELNQLGLGYLQGASLSALIHAQLEGTRSALAQCQRPALLAECGRLDAAHLGALFMHFMMTTSYAALLWGVNAYDQPAVELSKGFARKEFDRVGTTQDFRRYREGSAQHARSI